MSDLEKQKLKNLVWDYNLSVDDFYDILSGKKKNGWFDRNWAYSRVLQHLNYFDARNIIDMNYLATNWVDISKSIYDKSIKDGYTFVLQRKALSASR